MVLYQSVFSRLLNYDLFLYFCYTIIMIGISVYVYIASIALATLFHSIAVIGLLFFV